jgi:hypothetical protein
MVDQCRSNQERRYEESMRVMQKPNKPDAANLAMALSLVIDDQWRRVADLER